MTAIDTFREYLKEHSDKYVIIGGTACEQIFRARQQAFRATKDLDLVICVDRVDAAFATALKAFLEAGGYQAQQRSEDRRNFYRFEKPAEDCPAALHHFGPIERGQAEPERDIVRPAFSGRRQRQLFFSLTPGRPSNRNSTPAASSAA